MRSKVIFFIFILLSLLSWEFLLDTYAQEACTGSPQPVIVEICRELERAGLPERVTRREFRYENPHSNVSIEITPNNAFTIEKQSSPNGSLFLIKIVDPSLLFRRDGTLAFPLRISLKEITSIIGAIRIDADSRCETILEFRQADKPLNLDDVGKRFNLQWLYPTNLLSKPEVLGTQVRVKRLGQGEATVTLVVRDGTVEIARATRAVLDCTSLPHSTPSSSEVIVELMTPERCFKPISTRSINIENGQSHFYTGQNVCSRPIVCSWNAWISHYTSPADAENDLRDGSSGRSQHTSGTITVFAKIPGRRGDMNGEHSGRFDIVTKQFILGQKSLNYWHRFTVADCEWDQ